MFLTYYCGISQDHPLEMSFGDKSVHFWTYLDRPPCTLSPADYCNFRKKSGFWSNFGFLKSPSTCMHSGEIKIKRFITGVLFSFFSRARYQGNQRDSSSRSSSQQCEKLSENYPQMKFLLCRYIETRMSKGQSFSMFLTWLLILSTPFFYMLYDSNSTCAVFPWSWRNFYILKTRL